MTNNPNDKITPNNNTPAHCIKRLGKPCTQRQTVTLMVSLSPPYSPFLNEYTSWGTNRLQVTLIVNDSRMQNYPVKLQMFIERMGSGVVMRTSEYAAIAPILLNGGGTEILSGESLSPYFMAQNNVFSGFDQAQYMQTGRIPDGQYRIGFKVVDARRSEVELSDMVFSQPGWFLLNDPPQLNLPMDKTTERVNDPQAIKFEWFPRHLGSMNAAFATTYQFELFALRVQGMDANQVAMSLPPDYTALTNQNNFILSQYKYMLEPGVGYAWRVKAMAADGFTLFQNNGYSEVFSFVYGCQCPVPQNTNAEVLGSENAKIKWDTDPMPTSWQVRLRRQGHDDDIWHRSETFTNEVEIASVLSAGTAYEYQLRAKCTNLWGDYSPIKSFTTKAYETTNLDCGKDDTTKITNFTPKMQLAPGNIIYNGEFPVKLTEVTGGAGTFTGKGRMRIPMLASIQVNMQFSNIKVNELNQVYAGEMVSVYDPNSPFYISDITDYFAEGDQIGNVITGQDSAAIILDYVVGNGSLTVTINGDNVTVNGPGGSNTYTVNDAASGTTIVDSEGNLYAVDKNGTVTNIGTSGGNVSSDDYKATARKYNKLDSSLTVTFENNGTWAFDNRKPEYSGSLFDGEYEKIGNYYVPWKLVPLGKSDKIKARVTAGSIADPKKLKFLTPTGTEFKSVYKNGEYLIEATGAKERDGIELYAIYMPNDTTKISTGKVKIASYPRLSMKVTLVPMADFHINGIISEDILKEIYKPYYIDWKITIDPEFKDKSWDADSTGLQTSGSGFFSEFTQKMKDLNTAYKTARPLDEESIYLFVFPDGNTEGGLLGDMPLKSRFGYIFRAADKKITTAQITQTVAHELGHGAFQLKHTFSDKYNIEKFKTKNLMDYPLNKAKAIDNIELVKYQWDVIYDPQNKLFDWMQGESEGQQSEEKPLASVDRDFLYVTIEGRTDTLYNGHTLNLALQDTVKLIVGYKESPLYNKAYYTLNLTKKSISTNWKDSIKSLNLTQWSNISGNITGKEYLFISNNAGSSKLTVDASDALNVIIKYEYNATTHAKRDTLVIGNKIKENKIGININIAESGILFFIPKDENYYTDYGFDDAMNSVLRDNRTNNLPDFEKLNISRTDYYVPWLGVLPNTEVEIKLDYRSKNIGQDSVIILECTNSNLEMDGKKLKTEIAWNNVSNLKILAKSADIYYIKAYSLNKQKVKALIGKLKIESRGYNTGIDGDPTKLVRIIRLKRSDETSYPVVDKNLLINELNEKAFKQAFIKFKLDTRIYLDSVAILKSTHDMVDAAWVTQTISNHMPTGSIYHIFIVTKGANTISGIGYVGGNPKESIIYIDSLNAATRYDLTAHELGHNLGLQHVFPPVKHDGETNAFHFGTRNLVPGASTKAFMDYQYYKDPFFQCYFFWYEINYIKNK